MDGLLMDLYTASHYSYILHPYRIQKVFEDVSLYGVVLRTRTMHLRPCLVQFILNNQRQVYSLL